MAAKTRSRSGQAVVELIPAFMIFFTILTAGLAYYRVMRASVIRQELVRNLIFAKINNSGTLTTPPSQLQDTAENATTPDPRLRASGLDGGFWSGERQNFVDGGTGCFAVFPKDPILSMTPQVFSSFTGEKLPVQMRTYAVIHRRPGASCP